MQRLRAMGRDAAPLSTALASMGVSDSMLTLTLLRLTFEARPDASAVSDDTSRFRLSSLPKDTAVSIAAFHPRFIGPGFICAAEDQTISPVTLEDGRVAGTIVDAATAQPVVGARIDCQRIEHVDRILGGGTRDAISDAHGQFAIGGLAPGIYYSPVPIVAERDAVHGASG